jgi:hypothetical protein
MITKKQRFAPDQIAVAIESFVTGDNRVVQRGGRLRGDDPVVKLAPELFIEDGASDEEIGTARSRLMGYIGETESRWNEK